MTVTKLPKEMFQPQALAQAAESVEMTGMVIL
jgi:hypothetical protein